MISFFSGSTLLCIFFFVFIAVFIETWMAENETGRGKSVLGQAFVLMMISGIMWTGGFLANLSAVHMAWIELMSASIILFLVGSISAAATGCALFLHRAFKS